MSPTLKFAGLALLLNDFLYCSQLFFDFCFTTSRAFSKLEMKVSMYSHTLRFALGGGFRMVSTGLLGSLSNIR